VRRARPDPYVGQVATWIADQGCALRPCFAQAQRFLELLDPGAVSFAFRTFSDTPYTRRRGWDPLERALYGSLKACWQALVELNRQGAAISVTINRGNGRGREPADIQQVRALFLDDDDPAEKADRFALAPHLQIQTSPGHYHHYWLVKGLPLTRFRACQRRLAHLYGGDNRVMALNQSMQLPGFWRRKNLKRPVLPRIQQCTDRRPYAVNDLDPLLTPAGCPAKVDADGPIAGRCDYP
jgi:hypothetical protein